MEVPISIDSRYNRDTYFNNKIDIINEMIKDFNKFYPITIYYKTNRVINGIEDLKNIKNPFFLKKTVIYKKENIETLNITFTKDFINHYIKINENEYSLLSFVGSIPFSCNLFYICQNQKILIPKKFYDKYIDILSKNSYKNLVAGECIICKDIINLNRKYHSHCNNKIRFVQDRWKRILYSPHTRIGNKFITNKMEELF